jgi:hypothetical protein
MTDQLSTTLAESIREAFTKANDLATSAVSTAKEAIQAGCLCGELLAEAKQQARDTWKDWLAANVPDVTPETAQRYISGAKKIKAAGEIDGMNRRQLLLFFCSDDPGEPVERVSRDPSGTNWLTTFGKLAGEFTRTLDHRGVEQWSEIEREAFKRSARPIVEIYEKL